jgi:hypothetical protein
VQGVGAEGALSRRLLRADHGVEGRGSGSLLGRFATQVIAPRLGRPKLVPGPPKRFAQGIGLVVTTAALVALALGQPGVTEALLGLMIVAAGLESIFAFCIGCRIFAGLMRLGVIPAATCEACANFGGTR